MRQQWVKEGFIYGLTAALSRFMGVFLAPIYTRFLTTEKYGLLDLAITVGAILIILAETQTASAFSRSYFESKERGDRNVLAGTLLTYYAVGHIVLWVVMWALWGKLLQYLPGFHSGLMVPIILGVLPTQILDLVKMLLRLEHQARTFLFLSLGQVVLGAVWGITAVVLFHAGVPGILWAHAGSKILFAGISLFLLYRLIGISPGLKYLRELLAYGLPLVPAVLGNWVQSYMSRFFIVGMLSLSVLGVYSIASKIASVFLLLIIAFRQVWGPYMMMQFVEPESEGKFAKAFNVYAFVMFVGLVFVSVVAPFLVRILAAKSYWSAVPLVAILAAAYLWDGSFNILAAGNAWSRKTYYNTLGCLVGGLLNVVLLWWGLGRFGLVAVAGAFLAGTITKALLALWTAQRTHYIPFSNTAIAIMLVITVSYSAFSYWLAVAGGLGVVETAFISLGAGVVCIAFLWIVLLKTEEKRWLVSVFSRNA